MSEDNAKRNERSEPTDADVDAFMKQMESVFGPAMKGPDDDDDDEGRVVEAEPLGDDGLPIFETPAETGQKYTDTQPSGKYVTLPERWGPRNAEDVVGRVLKGIHERVGDPMAALAGGVVAHALTHVIDWLLFDMRAVSDRPDPEAPSAELKAQTERGLYLAPGALDRAADFFRSLFGAS